MRPNNSQTGSRSSTKAESWCDGTLAELKALLPPAKVEYVEKQPSLEDVFLSLVGSPPPKRQPCSWKSERSDDEQALRPTTRARLLGRSLRHILRSPDTIITTAVTPIAMLLMFVYVFGAFDPHRGRRSTSTTSCRGSCSSRSRPGVAYTSVQVLHRHVRGGILERFQSMPIARSAILWAHVLTSLIANLISLVLVVLVAVAVGFRSGAGLLAWLEVLGVIVLFTLALTWLAVIAGLPRSPRTARRRSRIR